MWQGWNWRHCTFKVYVDSCPVSACLWNTDADMWQNGWKCTGDCMHYDNYANATVSSIVYCLIMYLSFILCGCSYYEQVSLYMYTCNHKIIELQVVHLLCICLSTPICLPLHYAHLQLVPVYQVIITYTSMVYVLHNYSCRYRPIMASLWCYVWENGCTDGGKWWATTRPIWWNVSFFD